MIERKIVINLGEKEITLTDEEYQQLRGEMLLDPTPVPLYPSYPTYPTYLQYPWTSDAPWILPQTIF